MNKLKYFLKDSRGLGTVEIILIISVLIAAVIIFQDQIIQLVEDIFRSITRDASKIY